MSDSTDKLTLAEPIPPAMKPKTEELDFSPFLDYLKSPQGHEIASRTLTLIEDIKKATVDKSFANAKFNRWMEAGVIVAVVAAVVILSILDKLTPTVGILLGSIVGYFFGKNK